MKHSINRRHFLRTSATAGFGLAAYALPNSRAASPNGKLRVLSARCHLAADELSPVETTGIVHPAKGFGWSKLHPLPVVAGNPTLAAGIKTELLTVSRAVDHVVVRARLKNHGSTPVQVTSILWTGPDGNAFTMRFPGRPRYFSTENLRGDYFPGGTCYGDRYFNPLPAQRIWCS